MEFSVQDEKKSNLRLIKKSTNFWTSTDEEILIELYPNRSNRSISKLLNKTKTSVDQKAAILKLKKSANHRKLVNRQNNQSKRHAWTENDVVFLKENYKSKSYSEIGDFLNRTTNAVSQKASNLNLKKYKKSKQVFQDEANYKFPFFDDSNNNS